MTRNAGAGAKSSDSTLDALASGQHLIKRHGTPSCQNRGKVPVPALPARDSFDAQLSDTTQIILKICRIANDYLTHTEGAGQ